MISTRRKRMKHATAEKKRHTVTKTGPRNHGWCIFWLLVLFLIQPGETWAETIRMAWFVVPPHVTIAEDGTPTGPTISLFETIAARMGCTVEWVGPIPIKRLGEYQKTGGMDLDGAYMYQKTEDNTRYLFYPAVPYFIGIPSLAVRLDDPLEEINSIEDIEGYRIGYVKTLSSRYIPMIEDHRDKVIINDLTGDDFTSRNLHKVLSRRLDGAYERNQYTLAFQAALDNISDQIKIVSIRGYPIPHYYVFNKNASGGADLLRRYEEAVAGMDFDYDAMVKAEIERFAGGGEPK